MSLPHNLDAEESVLGAMLVSPTALETAADLLRPDDFFLPKHRVLFTGMCRMADEGDPVQPVTLADSLERHSELDKAGGKGKIAELAHNVSAASNVAHYCGIVREQATLRGLALAGMEITRLGKERPGDIENLVDQAQQLVYEVAARDHSGELEQIGGTLKEAWRELVSVYEEGKDVTGEPTGLKDLDALTGGLFPANLFVLAARPSMGKSALAVSIARHVAQRGPVALFSLEMSKREIVDRMLSQIARVSVKNIRRGRVTESEWPRLSAASEQIDRLPLWVDDRGSMTLAEIKAKSRRLKATQGLSLIVVDYLQLMVQGKPGEVVQEVAKISRGLKIIAKDLEVPVVALSQLSRGVEGRTDRRPILSDLRDSGAIEQDADQVLFVYRDHYYHPEANENVAELILRKNRNGELGTVSVSWQPDFTSFGNLLRSVA